MLNMKLVAIATVAGWIALMAGQVADLFPVSQPQGEVVP